MQARFNLTKTKDIRKPTEYVRALLEDYKGFAFAEETALTFKGQWRALAFGESDLKRSLDVEIGTANGWFFAHQAAKAPARLLLGIEIKFKPLILAIRRVLSQKSTNARICRFHAAYIEMLFADEEINDVYIHHPDPWSKRRKQKHRLMSEEFLQTLYKKQQADSILDFKTDSREYFFWATEEIKKTAYVIERYTENLHQSEWQVENYITQFEKIFVAQGLPIYSLRARKIPRAQS